VIPKHADSVPLMGTQDGAVRVRHREYLQDVVGSTGYQQTAIVLQPTNGACFPWLNNLASVFEQYRIMGMIFEYKSISSTAVLSTQALGSVMMACQYNTAVQMFASKRQILNHYFACSTVPYRDLIHPVECKEMYDPLKAYFTRPPDEELPDRDGRMENYANFCIATQGMPADNETIGELWVSYDIMLFKPRIRRGDSDVLFIDPIGIGPADEVTYQHVPEWPEPEPLAALVEKQVNRVLLDTAVGRAKDRDDEKDDKEETNVAKALSAILLRLEKIEAEQSSHDFAHLRITSL